MPGIDGLGRHPAIAADRALAETRVVILTTFELDEYVFEAIRAGASGFLVKDTEPAELLRAVRVVAGGDALLSPGVTRRLIAEFAARARPPRRRRRALAELTDREREVVALVGGGCRTTRSPPARREPGDGQDPRQPRDGQARRARPGAARGHRLRVGPGAPGGGPADGSPSSPGSSRKPYPRPTPSSRRRPNIAW